jgi:hypothetical protein
MAKSTVKRRRSNKPLKTKTKPYDVNSVLRTITIGIWKSYLFIYISFFISIFLHYYTKIKGFRRTFKESIRLTNSVVEDRFLLPHENYIFKAIQNIMLKPIIFTVFNQILLQTNFSRVKRMSIISSIFIIFFSFIFDFLKYNKMIQDDKFAEYERLGRETFTPTPDGRPVGFL